jgi:molecular chaperone GrpE
MHDRDDEKKIPIGAPRQPRRGPEEFDAISAARELEDSLAEGEARSRASSAGGADGYVEILEGEIAALEQELERERALREQAEARAGRAVAEVERSGERLARESGRELERRTHSVLRAFLEVLDDLDRAIAAAREGEHAREVLAGTEMVRKRFLQTMGRFGVAHRPALGERFDPEIHEAVAAVPVDDAARDGEIVGVVSEGYTIGDEVLRAARVAVGKR